jgi:AraC-like DNA-binding protein
LYELGNPESSESIYCCLPKGTICITISLNGKYFVFKHNNWESQPAATVFGLIKKREYLMMSPYYREITIGFNPHRFQQLVSMSMSALSGNVTTDLEHIMNKYSVEKLVTELHESSSDRDILHTIDSFLRLCLLENKEDARLTEAHRIITDSLITNVRTLSNKLNLSPERLRELYRERIGLTPKETIRIARIKRALNYTLSEDESLTRLAYDLQYFDQSHFIHDFRSLIGLTPKEFFKNPDLTNDFYNYSRLRFSSFA